METTYKERLRNFRLTLSVDDVRDDPNEKWTPVIDMKSFRESCFYGIPDEPGLRSTAWKVLLGYLPPDKKMWEKTLKNQRLNYYNWVKDFLEDPAEEPPSIDHPLNSEPGSKWASYFHDNTILEQIDKDVRRTLPDFAFFQQHVPMNHLNPLSPPVKFDPLDQDNVLPSESDPLSSLFTVEQETMSKKFSFGFMGRPRSSSSTSRKSTNNKSVHNTRARSNSKSSVRSFSSGILETGSEMISTPRSIVRKLSTVLKSNNKSNNNIHNHHYNGINGKRHLFTHPQEPICPYVSTRRNLFRRISHLNESIGNREHQTREKGDGSDKEEEEDADKYVMDYHWEAIERVLFIYAKLNPGVGYVQGMNELLAPIYYVFAKDDDLESQAYAEADSFFVFTTLMSDVRDHFVRSLDLDASSGINATLLRMSQRLLWFDRPLFRNMSKKNVKEQYYAFRWITVLCSQEWDLPDVIRLWDSILADRGMQEGADEGRFEFLLDFTVAMIICIRQELIQGDFADNMRILQNYPIDDIQIVLKQAYAIRESRLNAIAMGRVIPGVNDQRSSGIFSGDWSDTSSISSNGSNRFRRLTTDMARASIDSLRRGSKESLDDIFKRGMSSLARNGDSLDLKRTGSGDMTRSLSQKLSFTNPLAAKMKRTSSVRSAYSDICPSQKAIEDQIHKDWLLANQLDSAENGRHTDRIINPMRSVDGFSNTNSSNNPTLSRTNSLMNRFSKIVTNKTVSPYYHQEQNPTKQTEMSGKREEMTQFTNGRRDEVLSRARAYKGFV